MFDIIFAPGSARGHFHLPSPRKTGDVSAKICMFQKKCVTLQTGFFEL